MTNARLVGAEIDPAKLFIRKESARIQLQLDNPLFIKKYRQTHARAVSLLLPECIAILSIWQRPISAIRINAT